MSSLIKSISVYGAGSWGTALALQLARNGINVLLWDRSSEQASLIEEQHENKHYLPSIRFPDSLHCTNDLEQTTLHSNYLLIVVPSHGFRSLLTRLSPLLTEKHKIVWATKGLEVGSGYQLHQVLKEELPFIKAYGVVSGPTFALEVAQGLPTAMTVATNEPKLANEVASAFRSESFRVYTSDDIIGVELGGAIKNVLAIAAGISDGLGYGANARAALITRGLAEIRRLGVKIGAKDETLMGLAGVGDLVLTCTDDKSRNRQLGLALGRGASIDKAVQDIGQAIEGLKSSLSIYQLASQAGIEMPICQQVHDILHKGHSPRDAVRELLAREIKPEF